jgi:hypothetical protein
MTTCIQFIDINLLFTLNKLSLRGWELLKCKPIKIIFLFLFQIISFSFFAILKSPPPTNEEALDPSMVDSQ